MKCIVCEDESPFYTMRVPFQCSCYKKNGNWSVLSKDLWKEKEYPQSLQEFYDAYNQPERSKREDPDFLCMLECRWDIPPATKWFHEIMGCGALSTEETQ